MSPINSIHTVPAIAEQAAGPSYTVVRLCSSLLDQQQTVRLATLDDDETFSRPLFLKTFSSGVGPKRLGRSPEMLKWLAAEAASGSVDVLHNHSLWMMPNVYPGRVAKRYGVPLVVSPRGTLSPWAMSSGSSLKKIFWPLLQRPALASTTCFHATAGSEYDDIRQAGFRQPVSVIPNGIDIPASVPKMAKVSRTLLFLGRIHPKKGIDLLLPAWAAVQDRFPEWRLQIVGPDNGGYLEQMRHLAQDLGLRRVEFSGPLFDEQKWDAYRQADLFVLPTYSENFGMSVAEALAAGTPAIVSKGAPWDGLGKNNAGWWIDIGLDPLVACLESALSRSFDDLVEMGEAGRRWMVNDYSWESIGQQMAATYRWVLGKGEKPSCVVSD